MLELDNKKLSQRNARLKKQLTLVAADLQRSRAELAKLKTENELYSVKLPQLQAELLEETSQVDETQALSVQNQLLLTQFKARSHVLQTRNVGLEAQNDKLTKQVRDCQKQLKQKAAALQHQIEKANRLEADMNELKATHAQRRKSWNIQMESALKRFEYDKSKLVAQIKNKEAKNLHEGSNRAEKAMKKRRTAEKLFAGNLEGQLKNCKDELASSKDAIRRQSKEICTLEALLRKSHRIEGKLRNDLALVRAKCRTLDEERKCRMAQPSRVRSRGRGLGKKFPIELLLPLSDISDDDDQQVQQCRNCLAATQINELQSTCPPLSGCGNCLQLQDQLHQLHQELRRLRSLHTAEVHAQASAFDALLQKCS